MKKEIKEAIIVTNIEYYLEVLNSIHLLCEVCHHPGITIKEIIFFNMSNSLSVFSCILLNFSNINQNILYNLSLFWKVLTKTCSEKIIVENIFHNMYNTFWKFYSKKPFRKIYFMNFGKYVKKTL